MWSSSACTRSSKPTGGPRAGDIAGGYSSSPRCVRIFRIVSGWVMKLISLISPPQLMLVMAARGLWLAWPRRGRLATRANSLELAIIFATVSSVVLPFLAGALIHESKLRYVPPVIFLPRVWLLVSAARFNSPERRQGVLAAGVALCLGCLPFAPHVIRAIEQIELTQKLRKALDEHGLTAGYGDYWTAKPVPQAASAASPRPCSTSLPTHSIRLTPSSALAVCLSKPPECS